MKRLTIILSFSLFLLVSGCQTASKTPTHQTQTPLDSKQALAISQKQLGGQVIQAIPFTYREEKYIAARRTKGVWYNVILLKHNGKSYQKVWQDPNDIRQEHMDLNDKLFTVKDFDYNGTPELLYIEDVFGTAGYGVTFFIRDLGKSKTYTLDYHYTYYHLKDNGEEIKPDENLKLPENKKLLEGVMNYLKQVEFLQKPVDPEKIENDPEFAEERWYRDNGKLKSGRKVINIHWYQGEPKNENSIETEIKKGNMIYRSYFKAAVYAIDTHKKGYYVIHAVEDNYNWVLKLQLLGKWLKMRHMYGDEYIFNTETHELIKTKNEF